MNPQLTSFIFIFIIGLVAANNEKHPSNCFLAEKIGHGVRELIKHQKISNKLRDDVAELISIENETVKNEEVCNVCVVTIQEIIKMRRNGGEKECFKSNMVKLCEVFTPWKNVTCIGYVDLETDAVLYMIDNKKNLTAARVCSIYFQEYGCTDPTRIDWDVKIPSPSSNCNENKENESDDEECTPLRILHLTDFHYDPLYKPGSKAKCNFDLCCQKAAGPSKPECPSNSAGYWGSYGLCDTPWHTIENGLQHIKQNHTDLDYVYFTGDIISHRSWDTNMKSNSAAMKKMYRKLKDTFGKTPVFPILGNHEPHPTDFWASSCIDDDKLSTQWLFDLVADEWYAWLPNNSLQTVRKGGYYTVLAKPGFRVIALNSNVCYKANLWLFYNDKDPYGQLQWLANTLLEAEENDEHVHILSHVPPGNVECLRNWNEVYNKIVRRFARTIKAQFNGHTHFDEFRLYYNKNKTMPINVAYNGGSFTTFVGFNPNYRIYDVDQSSHEVANFEQWFFNLTAANLKQTKTPKWEVLYKFKESYKMKSMNLNDLNDLVKRMSKDECLMKLYFKHQVRNSDLLLQKGCNPECLKRKLCAIKSVNFEDAVACKDFLKLADQ